MPSPAPPIRLATAVTFAILATMAGTLAAAAAKYLSNYVSTGLIVFVQYAVCLLTLIPWMRKAGLSGMRTQHLWPHLIRGLSGWLCFYTYFVAVKHIPLVEAALLRNTAPLCVPFIVYFLHRSGFTLAKTIGALTGFVGVILILHPEGTVVSLWHGVGFLSGVTLALSMVYTRELSTDEPANRILFYYFAISTVLSAPLAAVDLKPFPLHIVPLLGFVGISIFITMKLYTIAYSAAPTNTLAPFSYFGVIFAGLLGWLFWDQMPDSRSLIGMGIVVAGGVITLLARDRAAPDKAATTPG